VPPVDIRSKSSDTFVTVPCRDWLREPLERLRAIIERKSELNLKSMSLKQPG